ncbi:EAL domain-containing protein [Curvibacter sp. RS43]|uniref:putative bifunctional diguanylate cyclase/phosphodiesterase n=1 Tax=Curvibacter microcysteis TaxID=3026419 RepID=UPI002361BBFD|nr:EAL domain-containing protein [Curvibacter sp. RS43]MDD0810531.1 EAL domain-containing protein [Curvibacter sp. RS43]
MALSDSTRTDHWLDRFLLALSIYVLPLGVLMFSAWALVFWPHIYPESNSESLRFKVAAADTAWNQEQALKQLSQQTETSLYDTHLSERPVWFQLDIPVRGSLGPGTLEFPSRHASQITCWDRRSMNLLGRASHHASVGNMVSSRGGFALQLSDQSANTQLLCQVDFVGPAKLTAQLWHQSAWTVAVREFEHNSGLLNGGLLVLAVFILITAALTRSHLHLLFAVWLVINLRMASLSAGWDLAWLERMIPPDLIGRSRLLTVTLFFVVGVTLFSNLLRQELVATRQIGRIRLIQLVCLPLLLLSTFMSFEHFLPLVWVSTTLCGAALLYLLLRVLTYSRTPVVLWYSASIAITLVASLYEIASAALGQKSLLGTVNSVTAALSSSLLASLAIAAQMRQENQQRQEAQAALQHTFEVIPIGLFTLDLEGQFLSANPAMMALLGPALLEPGSNQWTSYFSPDSWLRLTHMVGTQVGAELEIESRRDSRNPSSNKFLVKATLARDRIEGSLEDITERARATAHLQFLAHHDPLTKLLNRSGIHEALEAALSDPQARGQVSVAFIDLDRFKLINHIYGNAAGDEVLRQISQRLSNLLSGDMQLGRVGGDEFLLVIPQTRASHATLICQGMVNSIRTRPIKVGDRAFQVRGSIGLIEVAPGTAYKDAISTADRACRDAKASGGDHLVVFERHSRIFLEHEAEMKLVEQLSATSGAPEGLYLEMQPIMSLSEPYQTLNFEVLLRARDAAGELVPTPRLIAAAEFSGRMGVIDRWVISETLNWLSAHLPELHKTLFVCVNLSGASLNDERFVQDVFELLHRHRDIASRLCLEITESIALHDLENTRRFIDGVRAVGAKVALDDFGAGYTSFSYLKDLPADLLKIDGSFIVNMNKHPANIAIVEAIVNLARNLGMKTIAEWAEDAATVQTLTEIGVDYVQGFAIARSQAPARILEKHSAADFIQDPALKSYLSHQEGQPQGLLLPKFH